MKLVWFILLWFGSIVFGMESVTLQLPWAHQFQFAGYYVAVQRGFYREAGLNVNVLDAQTQVSPINAVKQNRAQYGVGRSSLVVDYVNGAPIVLMAAIYQSSPMVLLTRKDSKIRDVKDLKNKRVMLTDDTIEGAEIQAMLTSTGIHLSDLKIQKHTYDPLALLRGETDAMVAYVSNEPYVLDKKGIETYSISPKEYGFDFYSDLLFTTQQEIANHPKRTQAFYDASLKGWLWAFDHIEETAELIHKNYNPQQKSLEALIYEGKTLKKLAFLPDVNFGSIDPMRLEMIAQGYRLMGVIKSVPSFKEFIYANGALDLTKEEKKWLKAHPVIRVGIDHGWPPVEFVDESGRHSGISASYLQLLEKRLGIHFQIDYSRKDWNDSLEAVRKKDLDMLSSISVTDNRKSFLTFSVPYLKQSVVIVANSDVGYVNDLSDLEGKKVAVVKSHPMEEILRQHYPKIIPLFVNSSVDALRSVDKGDAYACLEALGIAGYLIESHKLTQLKIVGETPYRYDLAFAFRKDFEILSSMTNKVLSSITPSEYRRIHGQWLVMEKNDTINYPLVWGAIAFAVILFLLIGYKNYRLDTLVRQRTKELEILNLSLQAEIDKAVQKNRAQEKLLMQHAKMAEIGSMLESIAHQWRQPLNILGLTMTKLNLNCVLECSRDLHQVIDIAETQIQYMSQTIDDFRNFFKQDREKIWVHLNGLIGDVETLLKPLLLRKGISIAYETNTDFEILVYPNELKQVLINIINNAREAIETHASNEKYIYIRTIHRTNHSTIAIEDTGGGIPAGIIDKIFDPYFTTKFESQGTGIGLYMSKVIIEKHFLGKLSVYNTPNGACFEIRLNH